MASAATLGLGSSAGWPLRAEQDSLPSASHSWQRMKYWVTCRKNKTTELVLDIKYLVGSYEVLKSLKKFWFFADLSCIQKLSKFISFCCSPELFFIFFSSKEKEKKTDRRSLEFLNTEVILILVKVH